MADKKEKPEKRRRGKEDSGPYSSIATHPVASVQVRAAKGWGGLIGFLVAGSLSLKASVPFVQSCERALIFGVLGYLLIWALSMMVWRQWMIAEQRAAVDEIERQRGELEAQMEAAKQEAAGKTGKAGARQAGKRQPTGV